MNNLSTMMSSQDEQLVYHLVFPPAQLGPLETSRDDHSDEAITLEAGGVDKELTDEMREVEKYWARNYSNYFVCAGFCDSDAGLSGQSELIELQSSEYFGARMPKLLCMKACSVIKENKD